MLDCHAHILSRDTAKFPLFGATAEKIEYLERHAFESADLRASMDATGVSQALVVQRGQFYGADNSYICAEASASDGRLRAVCGIDSRAEDCATRASEWLQCGAAGLRVMGRPQEGSLDWLGGENAQSLWKLCADSDTVLCSHLFPQSRLAGLEVIAAMLDRYPLRWLIIDHLGNPAIKNAGDSGIDDAIRRIAERPNVALKFTTIPLARLQQDGIDSGRVLEAYIALFGPERLIWGSDITQSPGTYAEMVALARQATGGLPDQVQQQLLGDNTRRIYRWD